MNELLRKLFAKLEEEVPADGGATGGAADNNGASGDAAGAGSGEPANAAGGTDEAAGDEGKADEKVIPEEYAVNLPEGVLIDDEIADEFKVMCKDLKLSQEEADRAATVGAKIVQKQQQAAAAEVVKWQEQVKIDPELGGEKLEENRAIAEAGVDLIASQELKNILVATGMSEHPEVFRAFHKLGMMVKDDKFIPGGSRSTTPETSRAQRMFGTTQSS